MWVKERGIPMTIEEIRKKKIEQGYSNEQLSELSGVPLGTVQKIVAGVTKSPRYETLKALEKVLTIKETAAEYSVQKKRNTIADYYALPEEKRVELIDGVFYDMAAPDTKHQFLIGEIHAALLEYVRKNRKKCLPFVSPIDVQLDQDEYTMLQPDILVLCDRGKLLGTHIMGAPDLVIEVLSPSTLKRDITLKLQKYTLAGVREYWIVDKKNKRVIVYWLDEDNNPERDALSVYTFRDKIPVGIWDGACEIDFAEIDDFYKEVFESTTT